MDCSNGLGIRKALVAGMIRLGLVGVVFSSITVLGAESLQPEQIGQEVLGDPLPTWFVAKNTMGPAYVFDSKTGDMQGLISLTPYTPSIVRHAERREIYGAEIHYERLYNGKREDILSIIDHETLAPIGEVDIPNKIASLAFPQYIGLMSDEEHVTIFNMTPAASVTVVNVVQRKFVGEIATPGCALTMPVENRSFLMLCGDGALQLVRLSDGGTEKDRHRSDAFFSVEEDPVFDQPIRTGPSSWQLISFEGKIFDVSVEGTEIVVTEPWSVITEADKGWRVGGGQLMAINTHLDLLFVIVHEGGKDTHETPGKEVWVFNKDSKRRIAKMKMEKAVRSIMVTQSTSEPYLIASRASEPIVDVYDVLTTKLRHSIPAGQTVNVLLPY